MIEDTILYEDDFLICVVKPPGVPTQPDKTGDIDILTALHRYLKNDTIDLVHRLDRPVGGVLLFSKKKEAKLSQMVQQNQIKKEYVAVVCGKAKQQETLENYLQKNGKTNLSFVTEEKKKKKKKAVLTYQTMQIIEEEEQYYSLCKIRLETGRHHQIRVQLAHVGLPIWGDQKYNTLQKWKKGTMIALWAYRLTLEHPKTKEKLILQSIPKQEPFSKFTVFE